MAGIDFDDGQRLRGQRHVVPFLVFRALWRQRPDIAADLQRRMPATSERRWPVSSSVLIHAPAGPPMASQASHSRLISSSVRTRSRACSSLGRLTPAQGEATMTSRSHSQLKNLLQTPERAVGHDRPVARDARAAR